MKPTIASRALALVFLPLLGLYPQEADSGFSGGGVPPAPVVSSLAAKVSDGSVTLTWAQAPDVTGISEILRGDAPITVANESSARKLGSVPWNVTEFVDTDVEPGVRYWYAVISVDGDGTRYDFFLPASNSLIMAVSLEAPEKAGPAGIDGFAARVRNDAVVISWSESVQGKNLVLYRSTEPFTAFSSLLPAVLVSAFSDTGASFTDYPVPGVPYYYALLDEDSVHAGEVTFAPGKNTNGTSVEIPSELALIQRASILPLRPMPLPYLNPSREPERPAVRFSKATETKIARLTATASARPLNERQAYLFRSDTEDRGAGGDDYALRKIVAAGFGPDTLTALDDYLSLRRGEEAAARAHFYKGEALYFAGKYDDALLEFLLARDAYANQAGEWIQYALAALTDTGTR